MSSCFFPSQSQFWIIAFLLSAAVFPSRAQTLPAGKSFTNSIGMRFARIEPGIFVMGSHAGERFESPPHSVRISKPFYLGVTEVTNAQYEQFDPQHRTLRGKLGISQADDEAVIYVNWTEAKAFCDWLSRKENRPYRLPTEAEWEYACRAATTTAYETGDSLPSLYQNNQKTSWFPDPGHEDRAEEIRPLRVGRTPPNAWGLCDMHGNVEEWCLDWFGPYHAGQETDPVGPATGEFRVSRGGSHSTELYYLRSSCRLGNVPEDRNWLTGLRVALGGMPSTPPTPVIPRAELYQQFVSQDIPADAAKGPSPQEPFFRGPLPYIRDLFATPRGPFYPHNHVPALTELPNGDLLAIWFSGDEVSREVHYIASRLSHGAAEWEPASTSFFTPPGRTTESAALWWDGDRTVYHFQGMSAAATWGNQALLMRTSTDNGVTWSRPVFINPEHGLRNQVIASVIRLKNGAVVFSADAVSGAEGGTVVWVSTDGAKTFHDPCAEGPPPDFREGATGAWIAGIHGAIAPASDGEGILAFGRRNDINGHMPMSVSRDLGKTWTYHATTLEPLSYCQRATVLRLKEGPLFIASFSAGMKIRDAAGKDRAVTGLYTALSEDEGLTWSHFRLVTDGGAPHTVYGFGWGKPFEMNAHTSEAMGYLTSIQARNGIIHLISSGLHYQFNYSWLTAPMPAE